MASVAPTPEIIEPYMPKPVPPERDLGVLGTTLIWFFTVILVGGGFVGWFIMFHLVESEYSSVAEKLNFMIEDPDAVEDEEDLDIEALQGRALRKDWPDIRLDGVIEGTDTHEASVILDGVLTKVGGSVSGIKVLRVRDNGAILDFEGEKQWLFCSQRTVRMTGQ